MATKRQDERLRLVVWAGDLDTLSRDASRDVKVHLLDGARERWLFSDEYWREFVEVKKRRKR